MDKDTPRLAKVGFFRRTHALKGALVLELYQNGLYEDSLNKPLLVKLEGQLVQVKIKRVFAKVKDICKVELEGVDSIDQAKKYTARPLLLEVDEGHFLYEDLIGLKVRKEGKVVAHITGVYDFGAGVVLDTNYDMISIDDLDLNSINGHFINWKE